MVVIDQYKRRIIGFSVHQGTVTGLDLCWMLNKIIAQNLFPRYLSSDNEPLFLFQRWQANLRKEIKTVPYVQQ